MIKHSSDKIFLAIHGWNLSDPMIGEGLDSLLCTVAGTPVLAARSRGFAHSASRLRGATAAGDGQRGVVRASGGCCSELKSQLDTGGCPRRCTVWDDEIEEEESSGTSWKKMKNRSPLSKILVL
ncbi:hypothetical protein PanWU01x14_077220 [Parasponia andersonii]|uniref:Uncharacterized protein n=1 Tax=Parasponia andersonii TaxID=3476 RepID=A0A2P5DCJ5_PARAD|nr:hypothetical protein PanWU01x14_077220 [Parasponia andersonii]